MELRVFFLQLSSDLSVLDLDMSFRFSQALSSTLTTYFSLGILASLTWPILIVIIPTIYMTVILQASILTKDSLLVLISTACSSF